MRSQTLDRLPKVLTSGQNRDSRPRFGKERLALWVALAHGDGSHAVSSGCEAEPGKAGEKVNVESFIVHSRHVRSGFTLRYPFGVQ